MAPTRRALYVRCAPQLTTLAKWTAKYIVNTGMVNRRWLEHEWVFQLAGVQYDYYLHSYEPILEDRPDLQRGLAPRTGETPLQRHGG